MIELASLAEVVLIQRQWQKHQRQRYTKPMPEYTAARARAAERKRIAEEYKQSEEKRQAKNAQRKAVKAAGKEAEKAENERWDRIFKEKHEDKSYYGVRV